MAENNFTEPPIDPELHRRLNRLRAVPARNPEAAARGKAKFIAEVDEIVKEQGFSNHNQFTDSNRFYQRWKEKWNMASPRFRTVFSLVAAIVLVAVFLFGGAGITAYAAQSALPGDALYSVKTGVEQTRVSLAGDAADRAQLSLAFAERRLDEIARLIANGRYSDIAQAVQEYEQYVQKAIAELATVAAGDATRAQELTGQVAVLLKRYAETLTGMVGALPDTARGEVERAIQVSNEAGSTHEDIEFVGMVEAINPTSWVVDGQTLALTAASEIKGTIEVGSLVKVEALKDANGSLILREVELATQDDMNENGNVNGNANEDDGNENEVNENEANDNEGNENESGEDEEFSGIVEQIAPDFWVIDGQMFAISPGSEIDASIQVGDLVKVEAVRDASGNLLLREVDLAQGDDANENDDNGNLNDNDDDQGDDDQNSNDDNANGNINANDNGGDDDHEGNVNGNFNDNSGDDNQNVNDNGNANDNGDTNDNGDDDAEENANGNANDNGDDHEEENDNDSGGDNGNDNSGYED